VLIAIYFCSFTLLVVNDYIRFFARHLIAKADDRAAERVNDLNRLSDDRVVERTGLTQIVRQPTRGANLLDRVFVSNPQLYDTVRVVSSVVKSDHKAVVVMSSDGATSIGKTSQQRTYRPKTPS